MQKCRQILGLICLGLLASTIQLTAQQKQPNILVIWGDDVGYWNISAYNRGQMGYRTLDGRRFI